MQLHKKHPFLSTITCIAAAFYLQACSSSDTANEDEMMEMESMEASGADEVGSVPEDMFADEVGADGATEGATAATGTPTGDEDPFADLQTEDAGSAVASTPSASDSLSDTATDSAFSEPSAPASSSGSSTTGATDYYVVRQGDTLMKIAFSLYGDLNRWRDLHDWNQDAIRSANHLAKGMRLKYEVPEQKFSVDEYANSYLIKKGDTLAGISGEVYGTRKKWKKLQSYNSALIRNPHLIFAGFTIYYEITQQELAEAEAHRRTNAAAAAPVDEVPADHQEQAHNNAPAPASTVPSVINGDEARAARPTSRPVAAAIGNMAPAPAESGPPAPVGPANK